VERLGGGDGVGEIEGDTCFDVFHWLIFYCWKEYGWVFSSFDVVGFVNFFDLIYLLLIGLLSLLVLLIIFLILFFIKLLTR
jgi:hypothetical protein